MALISTCDRLEEYLTPIMSSTREIHALVGTFRGQNLNSNALEAEIKVI